MKTKAKIITFISILILLIIWISLFLFFSKIEKVPIINKWLSLEDLEIETIQKEEKKIDKASDRMKTLRNKIALKWLIANWDLYFENKEYTAALIKYLQVYKDIPEDPEINLKLWNIYYNLNKYSKAYSYYEKIKTYTLLDNHVAIKSLINSSSIWTWTISEINNEIDSFSLSKQQKFYYKNSMVCLIDFHQCRKNFWEYFEKNENTSNKDEIENNETEINETKEETFQDLEKIKEALINYNNFQTDDLWYKSALISWAYYENGFYYLALWTAKIILEENKNYKAILKIAAKSSYELWDYIWAKKFLIKYNKIESNDPEVSYFLWRIYEKLNENILSIIHFNKAVRIWYENITDIRRRLIFIYFELDDSEKMLNIFKDLIKSESKNLNINDYNLAIYYHIINNDLKTAETFSKIGKEKFRESELFYWYYSWILLQKEELSDYQIDIIGKNIDKWLEINDKNPMIVMVKWILELKKENLDEAFIYFKKAISLDKSWDFKETTKFRLENIPKKTDNNQN